MLKTQYLIVGGGIAGTTAAETIRQNDTNGIITIVSDEPHRLYSRIMLSKANFFLGKSPFDSVWMKTPEWYKENHIELILGKFAVACDTIKKSIELNDGTQIQFEKLLLSLGGHARKWPADNGKKTGIFYLRTLDDAKGAMVAIKKAKRAVCIGGGFTSFEMCDMLKLAGVETTVIIRESYFWQPVLDEPSGKIIEKAVESAGIKIIHESAVKKILGEKNVTGIQLENGDEIPCDMIIVGIGITTDCEWVEKSGISINRGVLANEYLETNIENIWTAGDCAKFNDLLLDEYILLGNWANAQNQGKIAGLNMVGKKQVFQMVSSFSSHGFGLHIAFTGDVRSENREVIKRGSPESNSYGRIIIDDHDEIVGATFINMAKDLIPTAKLIEKEIKVLSIRKQLEDANQDLSKI